MSERSGAPSGWAIGGVLLAATLMLLMGLWGILAGISAIASDAIFLTAEDYTYDVDLSAWGWVHLVLGVLSVIAGFALFTGATWARIVGIILAVLAAVNYFLFLPFYPIWSIIVIAVSVFIIWALATTSRREMAGY
jgi:hypothetical protein